MVMRIRSTQACRKHRVGVSEGKWEPGNYWRTGCELHLKLHVYVVARESDTPCSSLDIDIEGAPTNERPDLKRRLRYGVHGWLERRVHAKTNLSTITE
eukprot:2799925-Amphidinium_carterae.1